MNDRFSRVLTLALALAVPGAAAAAPPSGMAQPGGPKVSTKPAAADSAVTAPAAAVITRDPLDAAFRFATAIETDPNDQAMAQEQVVDELIALGRLADAGDRARRIKGWRQGTACADVARAFAEKGDAGRAREFLSLADTVRGASPDWGGPRVAAHMAEALAILGDVERSAALAREVASGDPRQYTGRAAVAMADGAAATGDFASAMGRLRALDKETDFDVTWWRTTGYLDLSRRPGATAEQTAEALRAARRSADGVAGWKRGEALVQIAREQIGRHLPQEATEALTVATQVIEPLPPTLPTKAALMSDLAAGWGLRGDTPRARRLLERAEREAPQAAVIDQAGALGSIAGARWSIGDRQAARSLFDRSLSEAKTLVNARPRALAVVDICRSMARCGFDVQAATQTRLKTLFDGLRDPW